jgi:hypothetical protein
MFGISSGQSNENVQTEKKHQAYWLAGSPPHYIRLGRHDD